MNKLISLAVLIGGIVALVYGVAAADSISSSFSRLFTGHPTDRTIWLLIGGAVATAIGATGLLRSGKYPQS